MEHISMNDPCMADLTVLKNLIKKKVQVNIMDNKHCNGWVQSIDPVSKSFILVKYEDENDCSEVTFIPGYNIKDVHVFHNESLKEMSRLIDKIFLKEEVYYSKADIEKRREALCVWFSHNRIPYSVTDNLDIQVLQVATIVPPYTIDTIHCKNEVILDKIMGLVRKAPGLEKNVG